MSSLIANKIKINLFLFSTKLFIVRTILCATIYNSMYQTIISLFVVCLTIIRHSAHNGDHQTMTVLFTRKFTQGWLTTHWLLPALFCLLICARLQFDEGSWSETFGVSLSREILCDSIVVGVVLVAFAYLFIPFALMFVVVGLLGTCSMYLLVCSCVVCYIVSICVTILRKFSWQFYLLLEFKPEGNKFTYFLGITYNKSRQLLLDYVDHCGVSREILKGCDWQKTKRGVN